MCVCSWRAAGTHKPHATPCSLTFSSGKTLSHPAFARDRAAGDTGMPRKSYQKAASRHAGASAGFGCGPTRRSAGIIQAWGSSWQGGRTRSWPHGVRPPQQTHLDVLVVPAERGPCCIHLLFEVQVHEFKHQVQPLLAVDDIVEPVCCGVGPPCNATRGERPRDRPRPPNSLGPCRKRCPQRGLQPPSEVAGAPCRTHRRGGQRKAHLTTCGCLSSFSSAISLMAVLGTPSSSCSRRIFLSATTSLVKRSRALYTTP